MNLHNVPTTFMAGATGFLGHFVLRDLLHRGRRVAAMLRPPLEKSTRRLGELMRRIDVQIDDYRRCGQLVLVEGQLPDLLPAMTWGRTDDVLNCAASLQLVSDDSGEPERTNVDGARA